MPWKECHVMDERLRFVARLLEGEKMAPLCAEFGISRKTGYKIYDRYKDCGVGAFSDRTRRPASPGEPSAGADRGDDRAAEARVSRLGGAEDPREIAPAVHRPAPPGDQHGPCGARPARPGAPPPPPAAPGGRNRAVQAGPAECPLVRGLQRRIHARQSPVLLPADDHRLRQPVPADL